MRDNFRRFRRWPFDDYSVPPLRDIVPDRLVQLLFLDDNAVFFSEKTARNFVRNVRTVRLCFHRTSPGEGVIFITIDKFRSAYISFVRRAYNINTRSRRRCESSLVTPTRFSGHAVTGTNAVWLRGRQNPGPFENVGLVPYRRTGRINRTS